MPHFLNNPAGKLMDSITPPLAVASKLIQSFSFKLRAPGILIATCLAGFSFSAQGGNPGDASTSGTLVANGNTVELPYVYVYPEKKGFYDEADPTWTIIFVEQPIEESQLDDSIWDMAYIRIGITQTAEFSGTPELQVLSQEIRFDASSNGNITGGEYPELALSGTGPELFEGRVFMPEAQKFFDDSIQYDFTFSAPLSDPFAPRIIGDPLPDGGGEPAAAYLAWIEAVHAGDIEGMKSLVPAEQAAMLDDPAFLEDLEFMKTITPTNVGILSGSSDGENAILQVTGKMEGEDVEGEITLLLYDGHWIATEAAW